MALGIFSLVLGALLAVSGVRIATTRPRPASLGGALLAPAGVLLGYVGLLRVLGTG